MSNDHDTQPPMAKPTPVRMSLWALLFALMMLLFVTLTFVAMVLPRPRSLEEADGERRRGLIGNRTEEQKAWLNSYGWVDEKNKVAHIPVEEAMKKMAQPSAANPTK